MCLYPRLVLNPKYKPNKKNGGKPPVLTDERIRYVPLACGKCRDCRKKKARTWQVRLSEDLKYKTYFVSHKIPERKKGKWNMVTLTFSEESLQHLQEKVYSKSIEKPQGYDLDNAMCREAVRLFTERWRKKFGITIRHWLVTELGHNGTERIHMHGILWTDENKKIIQKMWNYGFVHVGKYASVKGVNYMVKYVHKLDKKHPNYQPKIFNSRGIGKGFINSTKAKVHKYKGLKTKQEYETYNGKKLQMPLYYRNGIYTDEEKEKLWLELLDKQIRYVGGVKVDVSTKEGMNKYYKLLSQTQKYYEKMGFPTDKVDWKSKRYENEIRNLQHMKRKKIAEEKAERKRLREEKKQNNNNNFAAKKTNNL